MNDDEMELYDASEYTTNEWSDAPDYAPSTATVRATYATDYYMTTVRGGMTAMARAAAFDRWLARVRAEAAAEALEAAAKDIPDVLPVPGGGATYGYGAPTRWLRERAAELREKAGQ